MARVYLGLGSNVEPEENLKLGIRELRFRYGELDLSPVYRNAAVGFDGDDFLNLVVGLDAEDAPELIQSEIERIHDLAGRDRGTGRYTSRPLDIDLLLYDDLVAEKPRLPRRDILDYGFVLRPLSELDPELVHPVTGQRIKTHWQAFDAASHPLELVDVIL